MSRPRRPTATVAAEPDAVPAVADVPAAEPAGDADAAPTTDPTDHEES